MGMIISYDGLDVILKETKRSTDNVRITPDVITFNIDGQQLSNHRRVPKDKTQLGMTLLDCLDLVKELKTYP